MNKIRATSFTLYMFISFMNLTEAQTLPNTDEIMRQSVSISEITFKLNALNLSRRLNGVTLANTSECASIIDSATEYAIKSTENSSTIQKYISENQKSVSNALFNTYAMATYEAGQAGAFLKAVNLVCNLDWNRDKFVVFQTADLYIEIAQLNAHFVSLYYER